MFGFCKSRHGILIAAIATMFASDASATDKKCKKEGDNCPYYTGPWYGYYPTRWRTLPPANFDEYYAQYGPSCAVAAPAVMPPKELPAVPPMPAKTPDAPAVRPPAMKDPLPGSRSSLNLDRSNVRPVMNVEAQAIAAPKIISGPAPEAASPLIIVRPPVSVDPQSDPLLNRASGLDAKPSRR